MRYPTSYQKALNAAKSVVYGTRKHLGITAVGLALIAAPAACGDSETTSNNGNKADAAVVVKDAQPADKDTGTAGGTGTDAGAKASEDAGGATGGEDVAKTAEDTGGSTEKDTGPTAADTGPTTADVDDAPKPDVAVVDAVSTDTANDCIKTCYQPTGDKCAKPEDCNIAETLGKCANNDKECKPGDCDKDVACEGYKYPMAVNVGPDGKAPGWGPINCLDGECHHGQALSQAAGECCSKNFQKLCPDTQMTGCSPWGPPAPPQFDGRRLRDLIKAVA